MPRNRSEQGGRPPCPMMRSDIRAAMARAEIGQHARVWYWPIDAHHFADDRYTREGARIYKGEEERAMIANEPYEGRVTNTEMYSVHIQKSERVGLWFAKGQLPLIYAIEFFDAPECK